MFKYLLYKSVWTQELSSDVYFLVILSNAGQSRSGDGSDRRSRQQHPHTSVEIIRRSLKQRDHGHHGMVIELFSALSQEFLELCFIRIAKFHPFLNLDSNCDPN